MWSIRYRGHTRQASWWSVNGASPKKARVKSGWYEVHRSHICEPLVTFWVHPSISINTPKQPWDGCPIMSFRVKCQDESLLRIRGLSGRYRVRTLSSLGCSSAISGTHLAAFAIQSMEKNTSPGPWDSNSSVDTTWCWRKRERWTQTTNSVKINLVYLFWWYHTTVPQSNWLSHLLSTSNDKPMIFRSYVHWTCWFHYFLDVGNQIGSVVCNIIVLQIPSGYLT